MKNDNDISRGRPLSRLLVEDYRARAFDLVGGAGLPPAPPGTPELRLLVEQFDPAARHREIFPSGSPDLPPDSETPLALGVDWSDPAGDARSRRTRAATFAVHLALVAYLLVQPQIRRPSEFTKPDPDRDYMQIALLAPSREIIQELTRDPDKIAESKVFRGDPQPARPAVAPPIPSLAPPAPAPQPLVADDPPPLPEPPVIVEEPPPPPPEPKPEPPRVAETRLPAPGPTQRGREIARAPSPRELPAPRRPSETAEKPRIVLESSRATMEADRGPVELARLGIGQRPDQMIESAIQQMTERGGGPQAVGDGVGASAGGYAPPSPGNIGSGLELLSDPKGVDFRPYLLQLLNIVRRNWYAVIPESARLGLERGRVAVQFSVSKTGDVPKLVISSSSNSQPLDRAAVAGVSASLPFPPLPADFTGDEIRLQFVFLYNMQR